MRNPGTLASSPQGPPRTLITHRPHSSSIHQQKRQDANPTAPATLPAVPFSRSHRLHVLQPPSALGRTPEVTRGPGQSGTLLFGSWLLHFLGLLASLLGRVLPGHAFRRSILPRTSLGLWRFGQGPTIPQGSSFSAQFPSLHAGLTLYHIAVRYR